MFYLTLPCIGVTTQNSYPAVNCDGLQDRGAYTVWVSDDEARNLYTFQNGKEKRIQKTGELKIFLGFSMSHVRYPRSRMYWSSQADLCPRKSTVHMSGAGSMLWKVLEKVKMWENWLSASKLFYFAFFKQYINFSCLFVKYMFLWFKSQIHGVQLSGHVIHKILTEVLIFHSWKGALLYSVGW